MWMKCQTSLSSHIIIIYVLSLGHSLVVFWDCHIVQSCLFLCLITLQKRQHVNYKSDGLTSRVQPCSILLIIECNKARMPCPHPSVTNMVSPVLLWWKGNVCFSSSSAGRVSVGTDQHRWHGTVTHWPTTAARKTRGFTDSKINK